MLALHHFLSMYHNISRGIRVYGIWKFMPNLMDLKFKQVVDNICHLFIIDSHA